MVRQPLWLAVGWIHADRVIPVLRLSAAELATLTRLLVPLKLRAVPLRPAVVQVAPASVATFPFPETSALVVPAPSLNAHAPTRPGGVDPAAPVVTSAAAEYPLRLPAASAARTR